jgi:hypothetical protein
MPYNKKVFNETPQMSTRSRVGLELADGSILSIYSHYDGYPEWAGRILRTHYNTREKVEELVDGGDVSCLWTDDGFYTSEGKTKRGSYGPQYYSQRGQDCPPRLDADLAEYLLPGIGEEYHYIFRNGEWVCYNMHEYSNKLPEVVEIPNGALMV